MLPSNFQWPLEFSCSTCATLLVPVGGEFRCKRVICPASSLPQASRLKIRKGAVKGSCHAYSCLGACLACATRIILAGLQKQNDGISALFLAALRRPQVAGVRTQSVGLSKTNPAAPKGESCGYAAIEALRSSCQRCLPEGRRGAPYLSFGAAEAAFHVDQQGSCLKGLG